MTDKTPIALTPFLAQMMIDAKKPTEPAAEPDGLFSLAELDALWDAITARMDSGIEDGSVPPDAYETARDKINGLRMQHMASRAKGSPVGAPHPDCARTNEGHAWVRRRDGRQCAECGLREFGDFPVKRDTTDPEEVNDPQTLSWLREPDQ